MAEWQLRPLSGYQRLQLPGSGLLIIRLSDLMVESITMGLCFLGTGCSRGNLFEEADPG